MEAKASVKNIPSNITSSTVNVDTKEDSIPVKYEPIKIVATQIKNGNLPLHGTNAFVSIASNLSRGESIILQPTTPAALQPNPIHIVNACFPVLQALLK